MSPVGSFRIENVAYGEHGEITRFSAYGAIACAEDLAEQVSSYPVDRR